MRLDHLLSREQGEAERQAFKPRSICPRGQKGQAGETAEQERPSWKDKSFVKTDPVSFSGFREEDLRGRESAGAS